MWLPKIWVANGFGSSPEEARPERGDELTVFFLFLSLPGRLDREDPVMGTHSHLCKPDMDACPVAGTR